MDKLFTVKHVANMLEVHVITIRRWIESGKLPAIKLEKSYRVKEKDLYTFLEDRKVK